MKILEEKDTIKMYWHFFAAFHGKGAVKFAFCVADRCVADRCVGLKINGF